MTLIWISQSNASQREVVRLAREALPDATFVASHAEDREDILSLADRAVREPSRAEVGDGPDYAAWLLAAASAAGARLVVASRGRAALAAAWPEFAGHGIRLACGARTAGAIETARRKDAFAAAMESVGVPVPRTRLVAGAADLAAARSALGTGPLCVKPASGIYGRGFWVLREGADPLASLMDRHMESGGDRLLDPSALEAALATTAAPEPLVLMEYLPGRERSVDCVCDSGRLVAAASRLKLGARQVVETSGPSVDIAAAVVAALGLDGLVNVQTREGPDGAPRVLEVNTRPAGGVGYAAAAGVNLPGLLALHMTGRSLPALPARPAAVRPVDVPVLLPAATAALSSRPEAA